jgi:hypothetical protein
VGQPKPLQLAAATLGEHVLPSAKQSSPTAHAGGDELSQLLAAPDYEVLKARLLVNGKLAIAENKGKWACLVSRRQFKDEAVLKKHVLQSQLFKDSASKLGGSLSLKPS